MPKALKASDTVVHHHKDRRLAEKFERLISVLMVINKHIKLMWSPMNGMW